MKMKILIIEDEKRTADLITRLIGQYDSTYSVISVIDSVENGIEWFSQNSGSPDLILADIQLTDGTTFELFDRVNTESPVIFITAYNEFALSAFRLNSIDYLLKPINFSDLKKALDKFLKTRDAYFKMQIRDFKEMLSPAAKPFKRRFLIKSGNGYKFILTEEIGYFLAEDGVVFAVLMKGGKSIVENSITELAAMLDPEKFLQINRNTIVNINAIHKISDYFNRRVILDLMPDHHEVIVSRERVQEFKEWMNR
jgi:DNA-binding LytR/AlgR family response regulator